MLCIIRELNSFRITLSVIIAIVKAKKKEPSIKKIFFKFKWIFPIFILKIDAIPVIIKLLITMLTRAQIKSKLNRKNKNNGNLIRKAKSLYLKIHFDFPIANIKDS